MRPPSASSRWRLPAAWVALGVVALLVRVPFVLRVGPNEGGGDEWYAAWRAWCVLFEGGNPGNFLRPALFYDAGAALFSALYVVGKAAGTFHAPVDLLADFVLHEAKYLRALQLLAATFGALTVPIVFELARRIAGWRAGLVAAGILTLLPLHVLYSQRARVDALCVLLTTLAALALHRLAARGRRHDFVVAGAVIGLATGANYPAALLAVPYVAAAIIARQQQESSELVRSFALGALAAVAAFAATNPYVLLAPSAAWDGFVFQLSFAAKQHPSLEKASEWFYLGILRDQSPLFAMVAAGASAWLALRGHGFRRVLGVFPWLVVGAFVAVRTQEDRYILIAMPWLCAAVGVVVGDALAAAPRRLASAVAMTCLLVLALTAVQLWERTSPRVLVGAAEESPRWAMQRWLLEHAPPGGTVWIESDAFPLVQATFADPGGRLQERLRAAFRRAYPDFDARVLKGEFVERIANYDAELITEKRVDLAAACDRSMRYFENAGPALAAPRAFHAALARHGTRRFEAMGCWIAEID